jgi:hypothetical protein
VGEQGDEGAPAAPSGTRIEPSRRWRTRPGALRSAGMSTTAGVIRSAGTIGEALDVLDAVLQHRHRVAGPTSRASQSPVAAAS